jgi:hypothetical protein
MVMAEHPSERLLAEISAKLDMLLAIMKIAFSGEIESAKERAFARSDMKKAIYDLCDGRTTVDEIARQVKKDPAYVRVYLSTLEEEGLVVKKGYVYEAVV